MSLNIQEVMLLNEEAKKLNAERQRILGAKEVAQQQWTKAVAAFKAKYGVDVTVENIESLTRQTEAEIEQQYATLMSNVNHIKSGEYLKRQEPPVQKPTDRVTPSVESVMENTLISVENTTTPVVNTPIPPVTTPVSAPAVAFDAPVAPPAFGVPTQAPVVSVPPAPVVPPVPVVTPASVEPAPTMAFGSFTEAVSALTTPVAPPAPVFDLDGAMAAQPVQQVVKPEGYADEEEEAEAFTPPSWGTPSSSLNDINAHFGAILGGNAPTNK